jgi:glycosyltransferase involved in cell wall biosynthesis
MIVALDATYSLGKNLTGVGVYSREIAFGLAQAHPEAQFLFCYRPHRWWRSWLERLPANARRCLITEQRVPERAELFHGLNQRLPRVPLRRALTTFHDLFVITGEYSTPEFRARFRRQALEAAERSQRIITVSEFTARQVADLLGVEPSRLRVIHHGVRLPAAIPSDAQRQNVVLHVGAIQVRKNLIRLVEAFEGMDAGWRLVLIGSMGYGAREILGRIQESPRRADIQVLGYVTAAERDRWYALARIFAFPSLDEGFGMPVLEAMAWGVPVVASRTSSLPEVAGDAAWLVDPHRADELTGALRALAADPDLRDRYVRMGRRHAAGFRWEDAVSATWRVYCELSQG